jgi:hypothetical protein
VPTFALSIEGVLFALLFGVGVWLLFHLFWWLFALSGSWLLGTVHHGYSDGAGHLVRTHDRFEEAGTNRSRRQTRK